MKHLSAATTQRIFRYARRGALLLALGAAGPAAWGQSFGPAMIYTSGSASFPNGVAVGDVTGDGRPDIVTANYVANMVGVLPGLASGGFGAMTTFGTGGGPNDLVLGDVNGDGRLDVVTANSTSSSVTVLLGLAGGFANRVSYSAGPTSRPVRAVLGDVNGDGRLDIATANYGSGTAGLLLGLATGGFGPVTTYLTSSISRAVALGDVNGDSRLDLVAANYGLSSAGIFLGLASGGFGPASTYSTGPNSEPDGMVLGDVNGDGRLDIVTANTLTFAAGVLLGQAGGSFAPAASYSLGAGSAPIAVALGDVNGDGRRDIVAAIYNRPTAVVLLGQVTGGFSPATAYTVGPDEPQAVAVADVNSDGRPDIVTANGSANTVSVLLNTGTYTPLATARPTATAEITMAPNPAHEAFTVQLPTGLVPTQAELLNALGQVVRRPAVGRPSFRVETSGLAPGLYTLRLQAGGTALARRVVVE